MILTSEQHLRLVFIFILPCLWFQMDEGVKVVKVDPKGLLDYLFSPCKCKCGVPNREARFMGGEYIRGFELPWLSTIQVANMEMPKSIPGVLINNRYVLTGASGLVGLTPYDVKVTVGQFDKCTSDSSSTNVSVDNILIHPDFSAENKANDIALVKLSSPVLFDRRVAPICLSAPGHTYLGQVATVAGWPLDTEDADMGKTLCRPKKLGVPVLSEKDCLESTGDAMALSADKGCVGIVGTPNVICMEDGGSPVMYRSHKGVYELFGIMTDQGMCDMMTVGVGLYTKVNDHISWIVHNTRDACYCIKT